MIFMSAWFVCCIIHFIANIINIICKFIGCISGIFHVISTVICGVGMVS